MFAVNKQTSEITMHSGDTGSFWVHASRGSGASWTSDDRMLFTIKNPQGEIVIQRIYRLDDQWDKGDGYVLIEFHNDDTDTLANGTYNLERRYDVSPIWDGTPPGGRCVDALTAGVKMVEGSIVRTVVQSTLTIGDVYGRI